MKFPIGVVAAAVERTPQYPTTYETKNQSMIDRPLVLELTGFPTYQKLAPVPCT
jgi:hypothetical protein